jgi:hypothetical protein
MERHYDIIIIGAGLAGSTLQRNGWLSRGAVVCCMTWSAAAAEIVPGPPAAWINSAATPAACGAAALVPKKYGPKVSEVPSTRASSRIGALD